MFINSKKIIKLLTELAPEQYAESWDNVGFLVGNDELEINKLMLALDVTEDVVTEAIEKNVDLIITHHPVIFKGLKSVTDSTFKGRMLRKLIKNDINVYSAHTNLDIAFDGLNDYLAKLMGIDNLEILSLTKLGINGENIGLGRVGTYDEAISSDEFIANLKRVLQANILRVCGKLPNRINKVGICTGAGADFIWDAKNHECDVYITGDVKYHEGQLADELGICIIDAGHFETENIYMDYLYEYLTNKCQQKDYEIRIIKTEKLRNPFTIY